MSQIWARLLGKLEPKDVSVVLNSHLAGSLAYSMLKSFRALLTRPRSAIAATLALHLIEKQIYLLLHG